MVTVARFRDPQIAHVARGVLESSGIHAVVLDEHMVQANWVLSQAIDGVKVAVLEEDLSEAREALADDFSEAMIDTVTPITTEPEDCCPHCGSTDIAQNNYSPLSLIPSILLQLPVFFRRKKWACRACKATW